MDSEDDRGEAEDSTAATCRCSVRGLGGGPLSKEGETLQDLKGVAVLISELSS